MKTEYRLPNSLRTLFQKHTLGEILQPLVGKVPKFRSKEHITEWVGNNFSSPHCSLAAASIVSLAKWMQNKKKGIREKGLPLWSLSAGIGQCALCVRFDWVCSRKCSLAKVSGRCVYGENRFYHKAYKHGDKQPLVHALELASVYALVDDLRRKCVETVREAGK